MNEKKMKIQDGKDACDLKLNKVYVFSRKIIGYKERVVI